MKNNPTVKPGMSDQTGMIIADRLQSLTAALWAEELTSYRMSKSLFKC